MAELPQRMMIRGGTYYCRIWVPKDVEIRNSRQISLIDFPWISESRRIFAIVSTTNIQIKCLR